MLLRPAVFAVVVHVFFQIFSLQAKASMTWQELVENPYSQYYTKKDIERITRELDAEEERKSKMVKGQVIMVDTRDQESCARVQQELMSSANLKGTQDLRDLCLQDPAQPISSVMVLSDASKREWQREFDTSRLTSTQQDIYANTRNVSIAAVGVAGILYMMPESISKWDKNKMKNLGKAWRDNVKEGPVVDKDDWAINFIGHPYSGAAYYQIARHSGFSAMGSFGYSVVMSTFFWEYGVEAFAETPSIQDLIITPVIGSIMGEVFYRTEQRIRANDGKVMGSKKLGSFLMIVMNPMGALSSEINQLFGTKLVQDARARWVVRQQKNGAQHGPAAAFDSSPFWGLELQFKF